MPIWHGAVGINMDTTNLMIDFYKTEERQAPGSKEATLKALRLIQGGSNIRHILDIGCGTGAQTIMLAKNSSAQITAVDIYWANLEELLKRSRRENIDGRITPKVCNMADLPFEPESFDLIWSEGAIYNIGFKNGLKKLYKFLNENGCIAVSEISWLTDDRPEEIQEYWKSKYSEIGTISEKLEDVESCGYRNVANFVLPKKCWTTNYYTPLIKKSAEFVQNNKNNTEAKNIVETLIYEAELYCKYNQYYSYVFYILRKI